MTRPPPIVRFERLYLTSFALGLLIWALTWEQLSTRLAADPRTAAFGWMLAAALALNVAIALFQWYAVARRGVAWVRWVVVLLTTLHLLGLLPGLFIAPLAPPTLLGLVRVVLEVTAAVQLFAPAARDWFGLDGTGNDGLDGEQEELA
ncbi:hypothetical protein K7957_03250 [Sphingomonas yunnanensis]|uniref:hypothetical protein n=1 Tax=Sphingomonas yunnanensis TaxID=310400 RepID=UPI001CA732C9|nr:hypothetical protein [Sphingomonas yunnanensis]MBY9061945.1 hypothetical protein [Sphingomonas yunnanensis]